MKRILMIAALLAAPGLMSAQISVGIHLGAPPPMRVMRVQPPSPGPGYTMIDGYWYPVNGRYVWHQAYWTRSPYEGAAWVAPRYDGGSYYNGYWNTDRGPQAHDHKWDKNRNERDYNRGRGWGRGNEGHDNEHGR